MFVCKHELPKIYMGRIQKYWDKVLPSNIPLSGSTFKTTFTSDAAAVAVETMENEVNTESCIALEAIPENTFVSKYVGVYDVEGTPGELTLLCPEQVSSDNVVALHYNETEDTWENIEDIQVIDRYVWGTLESFSPIAVFEYKNDIVILEEVLVGIHKDHEMVVVANGNTIKVYGEDDKVFVVGPSGVPVEITKKCNIVGGSVDGTPIESTNVSIVNVNNTDLVARVYGGSVFDNSGDVKFTTVDTINLTIINSTLKLATGSAGAVRVNNSNVNVTDSNIDAVATGQSMLTGIRDTNPDVTIEPDFSCNAWIKNSKLNCVNSIVPLLYSAGNAGNMYTNNAVAVIDGCNIDYYTIGGGSNGKTDHDSATITNSKIKVLQTVNRGKAVAASVKIDKCEIENFYIGGETEDKTVTGITGSVKFDVNSGTYNVVPGTDGGELITDNSIVEYFKISRSANVTISDELVALLGDKYIVK